MRLDRQERRATLALVAALVLPVAVPAAVLAAAPPADEPLAERVEVRMVLLDVLVTDAAGRTVPDLGPGDFRLLVDSTEVPVRSVDRQCPVGVAADPTAVSDPGVRTPPPVPPSAAPRRLVLVLDYLHLARLRRTEVLDRLIDAVDAGRAPGDEIMVVALANDVRVEIPFTADAGRVADTLRRMREDPTLWTPSFDRLTDYGFFDKLEQVLLLLQSIDGPKALLLVSDHPGRADDHDPQFDAIATAAAAARTAIYPVHASGLQPPDSTDPTANVIGGPRLLARLAVDSGGRMTRNTNDLSLGLARARRDLGCRYTVGFLDDHPDDTTPRRVVLQLRPPGLRVHAPAAYGFRDPEDEREATLRAALIAPRLFADGRLSAEARRLGPAGPRRWRVELSVRVAPELVVEGSELRVEVRRPTGVVEFEELRTLSGSGDWSATAELPPGRHRLSAVLAAPAPPPGADPATAPRPRTATADLELPERPRDRAPVEP